MSFALGQAPHSDRNAIHGGECPTYFYDDAECCMWQPLIEWEISYLATLASWDERNIRVGEYCARTDRFEKRHSEIESRVRQQQQAKSKTNDAVAKSAYEGLARRGRLASDAFALVLDGADAATSQALMSVGFRSQNILVPNTVPSVAESLRHQGIRSWAGRVQDYIVAPVVKPIDLVYLDHTGAFPKRAGQVKDLFDSGIAGLGSVLAFTFSTREGNFRQVCPSTTLPIGWTKAHAVYSLVNVLFYAADSVGLTIEGADLDGLLDYDLYMPDSNCSSVSATSSVESTSPDAQLTRLERALAKSDIFGMAQALLEWSSLAESNLSESSLKSSLHPKEREHIVRTARSAAANVLQALVKQQRSLLLGVAWTPCKREQEWPLKERGKPLCALGAVSALSDRDTSILHTAVLRVLRCWERTSKLEWGCDAVLGARTIPHKCEVSDVSVQKGVCHCRPLRLKRSLMLYPEQMMFLAVRVGQTSAPASS